MPKSIDAWKTALFAGAALLVAPGARGWELDAGARSILARGGAWADVLPDRDGAGLIHAAVDIDRPAALVWRVMTDCAYAKALVSTSIGCRVLQADPTGAWDVREEVTRGGLFFPDIRNVYRSDYRRYSEIRFHRVAGDLRIEEGSWRLEPLANGGVRVIYTNRVAANLIVPAFLARMGLKRDTPKVMMNLKRLALSLPAAG